MACMMAALPSPDVLAQSGVLSGPPQVKIVPVWVAVAGGFDGNGRHVGVGFSGRRNSREEAEAAALQSCRDSGRGVRCQNAHATNVGCLYIVPGSRRGGVTWGRGSTVDTALSECRRGGYTCNSSRVIGGCIPNGGK
ncbi:MAG: DUF4189 domain-containing protein [Hyphomicrobiales bacterium]|nr:DUF4189 domain-containing protein [Hyphomicrobiales bacterium]